MSVLQPVDPVAAGAMPASIRDPALGSRLRQFLGETTAPTAAAARNAAPPPLADSLPQAPLLRHLVWQALWGRTIRPHPAHRAQAEFAGPLPAQTARLTTQLGETLAAQLEIAGCGSGLRIRLIWEAADPELANLDPATPGPITALEPGILRVTSPHPEADWMETALNRVPHLAATYRGVLRAHRALAAEDIAHRYALAWHDGCDADAREAVWRHARQAFQRLNAVWSEAWLVGTALTPTMTATVAMTEATAMAEAVMAEAAAPFSRP